MPTAIAILARRRLAWHALLDMPVGLTPPGVGDAQQAGHVLLGDTRLCNEGPYGPGAQAGWLVVLAITNTGWTPVRGSDFAAPLTFTFPGRRILSAQISPHPAVRGAGRAARSPALCLSTESRVLLSPSDRNPPRVQVTGDFLFRPRHGCTITVVLSGTPAPDSPRIQQDGSLAGGKIIIGAGDSGAHPSLA